MESAEDNKPGESIAVPSLDEMLRGPRIVLGPFPSDCYENRAAMQTLICRPDGYTGPRYQVDIALVRAGNVEKIDQAKRVLALYEAGRPHDVSLDRMSREELVVTLKQMQELMTSIHEGEKIIKSV